jgi:hypothetical protein
MEKTTSFNKHTCAMQSVVNENAALGKSIAGVIRMSRRLQKEHDAIATECEQGKASCCQSESVLFVFGAVVKREWVELFSFLL